jgi:Fe(3+) dicitrate transport protein
MKISAKLTLILLFLFAFSGIAMSNSPLFELSGVVTDAETNQPIDAIIMVEGDEKIYYTDVFGNFTIAFNEKGTKKIIVRSLGYESLSREIALTRQKEFITIALKRSDIEINQVEIKDYNKSDFISGSVRQVEGTVIFSGKKAELILPGNITMNKATNQTRQLFNTVAGLNIWESDRGGLQMGIGARGLNPNRTSNFNVRQNGYDISADALGYPESYYTPPALAISRITLIRGAASLQYGTQFGGLLNFELNQPEEHTPFSLRLHQTAGSWGLSNTFAETTFSKDKVEGIAWYQYKRGNGWRDFSGFQNHAGHAMLRWKASPKLSVSGEYTTMQYLAQQPGGLTDTQFQNDPRQALRERNWFNVNWNLASIKMKYQPYKNSQMEVNLFGLYGGRASVGLLERVTVADFGQERDLIKDRYLNYGAEGRWIQRYNLFGSYATWLTGIRIYKGNTHRAQGFGTNGRDADFNFIDNENPGLSDFRFPSSNVALFTEHIFKPHPKLSITPGMRWEYIQTGSDGYFNQRVTDFAGNLISDTKIEESIDKRRSFLLAGVGITYFPNSNTEVYGNISQNYRAITFTDLRVVNPNFKVDPDLSDEKGFNADIGFRGQYKQIIKWDISAFALSYRNRIGVYLLNDTVVPFLPYRYRTNAGNSLATGIEASAEWNIFKIIQPEKDKFKLIHSLNFSVMRATYTKSDLPGVEGNQVEFVPPYIIRNGLGFYMNSFEFMINAAYTAAHYTDATNTERSSTAVIGKIPSYFVMDMSTAYSFKSFRWEFGLMNMTNQMYFTRRAESYPGPGIIPSDGINFYFSMQYIFRK